MSVIVKVYQIINNEAMLNTNHKTEKAMDTMVDIMDITSITSIASIANNPIMMAR